jgi:polyisoprenoid-binding protein YceI
MSNSKWNMDPAHSEVTFKVKHMMITNVTGTFDAFEGTVEKTEESFENANISFSADIASISTRNEQRDGHLKSEDFFNAAEFPKLSFQSTQFKNVGGNSFELSGHLTLKGVTHSVTLNVEHTGVVVDPYGQTKAGFEIEGKISRSAFGLTWNAVTEAGGVVVSDEVKLQINAQFVLAV